MSFVRRFEDREVPPHLVGKGRAHELRSQEYSCAILGLIFLRFAEVRFALQRGKLDAAGTSSRRGNRIEEPTAYHAQGILYLSPEARFDTLLALPEAGAAGAIMQSP